MNSAVIGYYRQFLADRWDIREAVCISYVHGIDDDAMIRAFGGDPADTPRPGRPGTSSTSSRASATTRSHPCCWWPRSASG